MIGHHNVNRKVNTVHHLAELKLRGYDVILLNEPPSQTHMQIIKQQYKVHCYPSHPKVALIHLNQQLPIRVTHTSRNRITFTLVQYKVKIHSMYVPPPDNLMCEDEERDLIKVLCAASPSTILLGDVNAKNPLVGGDVLDQRGARLSPFLETGCWSILNPRNQPTFLHHTHLSESYIDWVLASPGSPLTLNCEIDDQDVLWSDHRLLKLTLQPAPTVAPPKTKKFIHVPTFLSHVLKLTEQDVPVFYVKLMEAIRLSTRTCDGRKKLSIWNQELEDIKTMRNNLLSKLKRPHPPQKEMSMRRALRFLNKHFNDRVAFHHHQRALEELSTLTPAKAFQNIRNSSLRVDYSLEILHNDDVALLDGPTIARTILDHVYPDNSLPAPLSFPSQPTPDDHPITDEEIRHAIMTHPNKAPGKDGLNARVIQAWYTASPHFLNYLFRWWFTTGCFPAEYRDCLILPIFKDPSKPPTLDNLRPLGLSPVLPKMFERIIFDRIHYHLASNNLLSERQFGFIKGSSAGHALSQIQQFRDVAYTQCVPEVILSLDVAGAFNNVYHHSILDALSSMLCPPKLLQLVGTFLTDRTVSINVRDINISKPMFRGVPQGSVLGPLLFMVTLDRVLCRFSSTFPSFPLSAYQPASSPGPNINIFAFADDIAVVIHALNPTSHAHQVLSFLSCELLPLGLNLSLPKTKLLISTTATQHTHTLRFQNQVIQPLQHLRLLGVTFSCDFTFLQHLQNVITEAAGVRQRLATLLSHSPPKVRALLTTACVFSRILYLADVWYDPRAPKHDKLTLQLKRFDRDTLVITHGIWSTTGFDTTYVISSRLPLHLMAYRRAVTAIQTRALFDHFQNVPLASPPPLLHPASRVQIPLMSKLRNSFCTFPRSYDYYVFTDGSFSSTPPSTGAAFVIFNANSTLR